jgi:hypothetical protein
LENSASEGQKRFYTGMPTMALAFACFRLGVGHEHWTICYEGYKGNWTQFFSENVKSGAAYFSTTTIIFPAHHIGKYLNKLWLGYS